ncbi:SPFH domain-containing protein [Komagataeibacter melomenusus]
MPIIDLVKWNGSPNLLAWKYPFANNEELSTWTQLIVNETQEAYLVRGGVYEGPFRAGRHTLSTENLPVLRRFIGLPFGGRSPFSAEVWFVNKLTNLNIRWGTPEPVYVNDPLYNILIPIRAFGQYGIEVHDSKKFLLKLVGTQNDFTIRSIEEYFRSKIIGKISETLSRSISSRQDSVFGVVSNLDGLSVDLRQALAPAFEEYGLSLTQLAIQSINVPDNDPGVQALKSALAEKAAMNIVGYSYQQKRSFDVMETAAGNEGTAGGVMGAGMGFGMGAAMMPPFNHTLAASAQNMNIQDPPAPLAAGAPPPPPAANMAAATMERLKLLRELAQLKTDGILTDAEFETEKRRILGS